MREFQADGKTVGAYLAVPRHGSGPGVLVLHAWWGLNGIIKDVCDRLAKEGFVALAPDLYHGKIAVTIEEAEKLSSQVDGDETRREIMAAVDYLLERPETSGKQIGVLGFSLGSSWALTFEEPAVAIVTFYGLTWPERVTGRAAFLGHFAAADDYEPIEGVRQLEAHLRTTGRDFKFYIYPGTKHWFFEENRPEYNVEAARAAWERTIEFLHQGLD